MSTLQRKNRTLRHNTTSLRTTTDLLLLPHACCNNIVAMSKCKRMLLPTDPPLVVILNKVYELMDWKLRMVQRVQKWYSRYPHRATLLAQQPSNGTNVTRSMREYLESIGVRVGVFGWMASNDYIRHLAWSKVWFATTEQGDHLGTRSLR